MELKYRPEIDGLRTIAVLAVLIYHLNVFVGDYHLLRGGFLGVDVFFVISGYLITAIIFKELKKEGSFSFLNFYERRARRLLPALFIVIVVSLPFAWTLLLPEQLIDYANSILSSLAFSSNFYWFFSLQQYGAESGLLKPFLHTWSLGIEEQYYLIFPLFLMLIYRYWPKRIVPIFTLVLMVSLLFAEWVTRVNSTFSFYLLPSRFWELLVGGLLALGPAAVLKQNSKPWLHRIMPMIGLCLIILSLAFVSHGDYHPGLITLLPVLGTALVIIYASKEEWVTKILSSKPFVAIGLISYSLYLWHYPVFAFGRILDADPSIVTRVFWVVTSIFLAVGTYFIIEKPFRSKEKITVFSLVGTLAGSAMVIAGAMIALGIHQGYPQRFNNPELARFQIDTYLNLTEFRSFNHPDGIRGRIYTTGQLTVNCFRRDPREACVVGNGKFVTLGDSFVAHYDRALYEMLDQKGQGMIALGYGQCPFVPETMYFATQNDDCGKINTLRWQVINSFKSPRIFLVSANEGFFPFVKFSDPSFAADNAKKEKLVELVWSGYRENIAKLANLGHKVIVIGSLPRPSGDAKGIYMSNLLRNSNNIKPVYSASDNRRILEWDAEHYKELEHPNVMIFEPAVSLCELRDLQAVNCLMVTQEGPVYNQGRHLSYFGAKMVLNDIFDMLNTKGWL